MTFVDMGDVRVVEGSDDMHDGVAGADVGQELVPQAFALGRAGHQAGDIDECDSRRFDRRAVIQLGKLIEALIGDGDDTRIRLDGGERIISCQDITASQCIEQGRLADIRQTDDSDR
jgi:hypothetical protein